MKTLTLLSLSLAVALGMQPIHPGVPQNPVLTKGNQRPLLGDLLPAQGHVVVEDPAPQIRLDSEKQKKLAPVSMEQSQSTVELQIEVKPKVVVEQEGEVKTEAKKEPEVKAEPQTKPDSDVKAEPEVKVEPEVKAEPEAEAEPEVKVEHELNSEPEVMAELEANVESLVEMEELEDNPDFKVESEVKADPGVQEETEDEVKLVFNEDPEFQEVQEKFQVQMNLEEETEHREFDMQEKYEMVDEPIMELEPLDDDNDELNNMELSEARKSVRAAFQNEEPVNEPLPEDEALMRRRDYVLEEEPIMESEMEQEQVVEDAASMEEGPALDITGQQMPLLEEIFPNEEARMGMMGMEPDTLSNYTLMKEPRSEFVGEEELSPASLSFEEPAMEDSPALDGGVQPGVVPIREKKAMMRQGLRAPVEEGLEQATRQHWCPGVVLEGKCYQFFKEPRRAEDAEFFCQKHFPGGHLASITSHYIHRAVMRMMLQQNGAYTRTWVGGLRYLKTGRFIWLDGSHWSYADWLSGEPNNTADVEDCVEVLAFGNGKFNDFTCWEPQAFICSYPYP